MMAQRLVMEGCRLHTRTNRALAAMNVRPKWSRALLYDKLVRDLHRANVWPRLDLLYVLCAHDNQAASVNLIEPGRYTCVALNSPTFAVDQGYTGDAATSYLDTVWTASTAGGRYVQNSGTIGAWVGGAAADGDKAVIGALTNGTMIRPAGLTSFVTYRVNQGTDDTVLVTSRLGHWTARRTGGTANALFQDATSIVTGTTASATIPTTIMSILAWAGTGSFSDDQVQAAYVGRSLVAAEISSLHTVIGAFRTGVGL